MPVEIVKFDDESLTFDQDLKVVELLCSGLSTREAARELSLPLRAVERSLIRTSGGVSPTIRERELLLLYEQMNHLHRAHYPKALEGDYDSTVAVLRCADMRARLFGLYAPVNQPPVDDSAELETSTDKIRAALDRVCGIAPPVIDGEGEPVDGGDG